MNLFNNSSVCVQKGRRTSSMKVHAMNSWNTLPIAHDQPVQNDQINPSTNFHEKTIRRTIRIFDPHGTKQTNSTLKSNSFDVYNHANHVQVIDRRMDHSENVSKQTIYLTETNGISIPKEIRVSVIQVSYLLPILSPEKPSQSLIFICLVRTSIYTTTSEREQDEHV